LIFDPFFRFGNDFSPFVKVTAPHQIVFVPSDFSFSEWQLAKLCSLTPLELKELGNNFFSK
jgi:hypothetical protein